MSSMNLLAKSIAKRSLFSSSFSPQKSQLFLLQQSSRFASTSTTRKTKNPKPEIPEPQESYTLTSPRIETHEATTTVPSSWPKPSEIPYQSKVSNFVSLVGFVRTPIQFEADPNGKYCAGTVIVHENNDNSSVLMVPVVFMDDLAHVVTCHVKQNDCVYVSGKLSFDPLPFRIADDEYRGSFHIVAENVNFVQGLKPKNTAPRVRGFEKLVISGINTSVTEGIEKRVAFGRGDSVYLGWGKSEGGGVGGVDEGRDLTKNLKMPEAGGVSEVDEWRDLNKNPMKSEKCVSGGDDWRDLIKNPKNWWDCREAKSNGVVKARHPDFKKKGGGVSLWLDTVPKWVLEGLEGLEFDIYAPKSKGVGKDVDSWKDLVENPDKWWDNRATKLNQKAPDFKHKNTGIGLWLSSSPDWVLSRLPPLRDQQAVSSNK